ncbi:MAG: PEP-CTERM sorting domain-containing protein [Pirellulales bacterium]|nr:PEP-CTERM sorting domain-containing protein [Pirellulales bacterium]
MPTMFCRAIILVTLCTAPPLCAAELRIAYSPSSIWSKWNNFDFAQSAGNLIDYDTGLHTDIDVAVSGWTHRTVGPYLWPYGSVDWIPTGVGVGAATRFGSGISTISFSQLSGLWRIEILSSMDPRVTINFIQNITINGQFADRDYRHLGANGDHFDARVDGQEAANWLIWNAVAPENGSVTLQFDSLGINNGGNVVNAIRLLSVPEPSTVALLGMSGIGLIVFLWRHRRA